MKRIPVFLAVLLLWSVCVSLSVLRAADSHPPAGFERARFIVEPEFVIRHSVERSFIGPGMFVLENGDILMAAPWGRPPTNFEQLAAKYPVPMPLASAGSRI